MGGRRGERDIDPRVLRLDGGRERSDLLGTAGVYSMGFAADRRGGRLHAGLIDVRANHGGAERRERLGRRLADAGSRAEHQRGLATEIEHAAVALERLFDLLRHLTTRRARAAANPRRNTRD